MSRPDITMNKQSADTPAGVEAQKIVLVAQKLATGTATAGEVNRDVSIQDAVTLFGAKSMMASAIQDYNNYLSAIGSTTAPRLDVIALDDDTGAKATGAITFTESGGSTGAYSGDTTSIKVQIGNKDFTVDFINGATFTSIIDTLVADITADNYLPVTANNDFATNQKMDITYSHDGTEGNNTHISISQSTIGNVDLSITAMVGGAANPDTTGVLDVIEDIRYQAIVTCGSYDLDFATKDFLEGRFNLNNKVLDGSLYAVKTDTEANLITYGEGRNYKTEVVFGNSLKDETKIKGGAIKDFNLGLALATALGIHIKLVDGANIALITPASNSASNDGFGGMALASLPLFNTPYLHLDVIEEGYGFRKAQIDKLNTAGISTISNNDTQTSLLIDTVVTTYKTDVVGNEDTTWKYQNQILQMSIGAEYTFVNLKKDLVQTRLTSGDILGGRAMENEQTIKSKLVKYYKALAEETIVVAGKSAEDYFKENVVIDIDMINGSLTFSEDLPLVQQLREVFATLKVAFV